VTATRVLAFVLNVVVVVYLVVAKRLFGVRGGREVYERELQSESLLEVAAAGEHADYGRRAEPGQPGRDVGMSDVPGARAERADTR
jgi:hypothetical protein